MNEQEGTPEQEFIEEKDIADILEQITAIPAKIVNACS